MATVSFAFSNETALRIANLITSDIEKLEREAFGTVTNWRAKFDRPYKAYYANHLALRATKDAAYMARVLHGLPKYEQHAQEYTNNPKRQGRPLTMFVQSGTFTQSTEPTYVPVADRVEAIADKSDGELASEIADILREGSAATMPVSVPDPDPTPAITDDAKDALVALVAALTPQAKSAGLSDADIERVRIIAKDAAKAELVRANKPTLVQIKPADSSKAIVDLGVQHKQFPLLIKVLQCGFPVWLPGPAGSGKTTAAANAAKALGLPFHHTGAVDNVYQLMGFIDAGGTYHRTEFREAYENGGPFLWDEVDASNPAALVAFNAAIENGHCAFPDKVVTKHPDCYFIAAANTYGQGATHEYVGRTKIDAATVDRFVMIDWQYDETLERAIAGDTEWTTYVQRMRRAAKDAGVKHLITPRASIRGNVLLGAGIDRESVISMTIRKGLSQDNWRTLTARA